MAHTGVLPGNSAGIGKAMPVAFGADSTSAAAAKGEVRALARRPEFCAVLYTMLSGANVHALYA